MVDEQSVDAQIGYGSAPESYDAPVVIDEPHGVGPVMGFDFDDFFKPPMPAPLETKNHPAKTMGPPPQTDTHLEVGLMSQTIEPGVQHGLRFLSICPTKPW